MTIRPLSIVCKEHLFFRIDSEHCQKKYLANLNSIKSWPNGFVRLGTELEELTGGATPLGAEYPENGVRFLRVQNVMPNYIDDLDMTFITEEDDAQLSRSRLKENDVLLTITGVSYGKAAVVTPEFVSSNINQHSVRMHLKNNSFLAHFLATFLNSVPGKLQSDQNITGVTRPALDYTTIRNFAVPCVTIDFQRAIENQILSAHKLLQRSQHIMTTAEQTLLSALCLDTWQPPEPLTYERPAKDAFAVGRLDAEYFTPRVQGLLQLLQMQNRTIGSVAALRKENFDPSQHEHFEYIEISDMTGNGEVNSSTIPADEAPSRATQYVRKGDVITSTVRPIRRLSAFIHPEQDGFVCSSGFAVLRPVDVPTELLLTYLRLPVIAELMDLHATASMYPAISVPDILNLPFIKPDDAVIDQIVADVQQSHEARQQAHTLLERAKRAVEIAIEESEEAGLRYLRDDTQVGAKLLEDALSQAMVSARPAPAETATEKIHRYEPRPQTKTLSGQQNRTHDGASRHISDDAPLYPLAAETPAIAPLGGQADLPAANQPVPGGIPARLLAAMPPGYAYARAELLAATSISETDWTWAIRQLKDDGLVVQAGEKRGARYRRTV